MIFTDRVNLWVLDGRDGTIRYKSPLLATSWSLIYPLVADVDGDNHAEIVLLSMFSSYGDESVHVYGAKDDDWMPARKIWNQHAYFETNVNDDGTIPVTAAESWRTENTFRATNPEVPSYLADLVLAAAEVCEVDCDEGRIVVQVHPGNQGAQDVLAGDAPAVSLYAWYAGVPNLVGTKPLGVDVPMGKYLDSVAFDLVGIRLPVDRFTAEIHSSASECDPLNDTLILDGPFCE